MKENIQMDKEMEKEKNMIIMANQYMKVSIQKEKEMGKEKNIMMMVN